MRREEYHQREARKRYQRYLRTPHWHRMRLRVLQRAGGQCEGELSGPATPYEPWGSVTRCPATTTLQVHHLHYNTLGHESLTDLLCLCAACHAFDHLNACALCEEPIFESREDLEAALDEASLAHDPLDVLEAALSWHWHWPYCGYCEHMLSKD
jgi:hypothetical protein